MSRSLNMLVAGLGSPHGDDQAGWIVAEMVCGLCREYQNITVRRASVPLDVLDWLEGVDVLHLCDACELTPCRESLLRFRWDAGRLVELDPSADSPVPPGIPSIRSRGSHDFGLTEMLRLAEKMQALPKCVNVWAIAGLHFQPGNIMTDNTRRTVEQAASEITKALISTLRLIRADP